jgi:hypothetical protein
MIKWAPQTSNLMPPREVEKILQRTQRVLQKVIRLKGEEVIGVRKDLHNQRPYIFHSLPSSVRVKEVLHVAPMEEKRRSCRGLFGKHKGKKPLRKSSCRRKDNIKLKSSAVKLGGILSFLRGKVLATSSGLKLHGVTSQK